MFTQLRNIDTAFRQIKLFCYIFLLVNSVICGFCIYKCLEMVDRKDQRIHILYNGKVLEALASSRKANLPVELRDHIKTFHQYFFTLAPEDKAILVNIGKAMNLADESAKKQYDNLKEAGYYNNLIAANVSQQIEIDSIRLDIDQVPYKFICYATEKLVRSSGTTIRKLITQGKVRDIGAQTDNNPHGFLIQNWEILENQDQALNQIQP